MKLVIVADATEIGSSPTPSRSCSPAGTAADLVAACRACEDAISAAGASTSSRWASATIGHIGFNEPGSSLGSRTRLKTLTSLTVSDNARFFSPGDGVQGSSDSAGAAGGATPVRCRAVSVSLIFDLDGTLIDSVYQHVLAWRDALETEGIELAAWVIHRKIGMSGGLAARSLVRESGRPIDADLATRLRRGHAEAFTRYSESVRPLPGAGELLRHLDGRGVPWALATSGMLETAHAGLSSLGVDPERHVVVTRDRVARAKPDPDLFLAAAVELGADPHDAVVVGDSVWDLLAARRGRFIGVGLLSGGYGRDELVGAGAYRVYDDPADLLAHLDEVGVRVDD